MEGLITTVACTFSQRHVPKVSANLIQRCKAYCLKYNSVYSAVLSSRRNPSVSNFCTQSGVGAGLLCIPCPPRLISDRLFGISSLHQLDPLTDNLLPQQGWGLPGYKTKKGGGALEVSHLSETPLQSHSFPDIPRFCVTHSKVSLLHLTPAVYTALFLKNKLIKWKDLFWKVVKSIQCIYPSFSFLSLSLFHTP